MWVSLSLSLTSLITISTRFCLRDTYRGEEEKDRQEADKPRQNTRKTGWRRGEPPPFPPSHLLRPGFCGSALELLLRYVAWSLPFRFPKSLPWWWFSKAEELNDDDEDVNKGSPSSRWNVMWYINTTVIFICLRDDGEQRMPISEYYHIHRRAFVKPNLPHICGRLPSPSVP